VHGHTALVTTAGQMLGELAALDSDSVLSRRLRRYASPDVLVIDEVGLLICTESPVGQDSVQINSSTLELLPPAFLLLAYGTLGHYGIGDNNMGLAFRVAAICGMTTLALAASAAHSQDSLSIPTDTDLRAAYCIGIIQAQARTLSATISTLDKDNTAAQQAVQKWMRDEQDELQHLQGYLFPRMDYVDPTALAIAHARADHDLAWIQQPEVQACAAKCASVTPAPSLSRDEILAGVSACTRACSPEKFTRIWSCGDLSWLPF
jgi:hypothetical protein